MPVISEAASSVKSRFGFHDPLADALPLRSPANLLKSASKDNLRDAPIVQTPNGVEDKTDTSLQSFEFCEDPSFWEDHNVQVVIRLRPLSNSEVSIQGYGKCIRQDGCQTITWTGHPESRFTFDVVADESVSQEKLFKIAGFPMVDNCMSGYNSCMFAYGQTGSGKTHTMLGDIEGGTRRQSVNCGMTPRVFEHLFTRIQKEREARRDEKLKFTCKCSFLEIYNEQILDLLDPSSANLQIREDTRKGVYVENLKVMEVTSARDVMQQLLQGSANRKVAATNMNRASSRSHSVFTCTIESSWEAQGVNHHRFARLNLVDLAGSERQKSTGAEGERLKEATNINKSLSTLGLVIMNLVNISNGKSLHVPYRDSKLTFLLQDSLGGNSKTIMIANISPSIGCSSETLSTLKFAQRAKFIKNDAIVNEDASGDVVAMRVQIQQLKKEIAHLRNSANGRTDYQESESSTISVPGSPIGAKWDGLQGSFSPLPFEKGTPHGFTDVCTLSQKKEFEIALVGAFKREKEKDIAVETLAAENQAAMRLVKEREVEIQGLKMRLRFREEAKKRLEAVQNGKISVESHILKEKEELLKEIQMLRAQVDRNPEVTRFAMENLRLKEEIRRLKSFCEEGEREMSNKQIALLQNKLLEALDWKLMQESDTSIPPNEITVKEANEDANVQTTIQTAEQQVSPWRTAVNEENEFLRLQAIQNQSEMDSLRKKLNLCFQERERLETSLNELSSELQKERSTQKLKTDLPSFTDIAPDAQNELKTMVEAIAAASQRETEAHQSVTTLSKENDELRKKLRVLIEDNNKLIQLYEQAAAEATTSSIVENQAVEKKNAVENLEHQLAEMHEENEKLMGLYEKAMQERDELKRMLNSAKEEIQFQKFDIRFIRGNITLVREKLDMVGESLSTSTAQAGRVFQSMTKSRGLQIAINSSEDSVSRKRNEIRTVKKLARDMRGKKLIAEKKLTALRYLLSKRSPRVVYFVEREARARARAGAAFSYLYQKKEELRELQTRRNEIENFAAKIHETDAEIRRDLVALKVKFEDAKRRQEKGNVLREIDNLQFDVKATELLKVEEEKTKVQNEMSKCREKLAMLKKDLENANQRREQVARRMEEAEKDVETGSRSVDKSEIALRTVVEEKNGLLEFEEDGKSEMNSVVVEYMVAILEEDLRNAEVRILEEELVVESKRIEDYSRCTSDAGNDLKRLVESCELGEISRIVEGLENVKNSVVDARYLLQNYH